MKFSIFWNVNCHRFWIIQIFVFFCISFSPCKAVLLCLCVKESTRHVYERKLLRLMRGGDPMMPDDDDDDDFDDDEENEEQEDLEGDQLLVSVITYWNSNTSVVSKNCVRFCFWHCLWLFCLCTKYLGNCWTDLYQIHRQDMFSPSLGRVWRSRSKVIGSPGTKTAFLALLAACVWFMFCKTSSL